MKKKTIGKLSLRRELMIDELGGVVGGLKTDPNQTLQCPPPPTGGFTALCWSHECTVHCG
jgi:hypothetical protein